MRHHLSLHSCRPGFLAWAGTRNMRSTWQWLGAIGLATIIAGCGGNGDGEAAPSGTATVGVEGGRVFAESAEVRVPPGAIAESTTVRIAEDSTGAPPLPSWAKASGAMLQLTPHGSTFSEPVTVRIRAPNVTLAANERLMIAKAQPDGAWEALTDTQLVDGQLEVQVRSFSYFVPVIVTYLQGPFATFVPFGMSPVTFSCGGAPCPTPTMLGPPVIATSSGNGGQLPAGCVNPLVSLGIPEATTRPSIQRLPALPSTVLSGAVDYFSVSTSDLYGNSRVRIQTYLTCRDAVTDATSRVFLSVGEFRVDAFLGFPAVPLVRVFPAALTLAPGDNLTISAVLMRGASVRITSARVFTAPTANDQATVYLERLAPGESNWRIADLKRQTNANPSPKGGPLWGYWGFDFAQGQVTALDNGSLYRIRACYQAPTATSASCTTGPVATLTVVQQATVPTFTQQPASVLVQPGQTANFSAQANGTPSPALQWQTRAAGEAAWASASGGSGVTTRDFTTGAVTLADNGRQFRLLATNGAGTTASEAVTLSVSAAAVAPTITSQPTALTVVIGSDAVFAVSAQGTAALSYQWLRNGTAITGANGAQLKLSAVSGGDAGTYAVQVSNSAGNVTSGNAVLTVSPVASTAPVSLTIVTQPAGIAVNEGNVATFAVGVTGSGPMSFQWRRNGVAITGSTAAAITIAAASSANAGNYSVIVGNAAGTVTSQSATLAVVPSSGSPVAPAITTQPVSVVVVPRSTTTLAVSASGSAPLAYQWLQNGSPVPGANGPTLTLDSLGAISNGSYTVTVSNATGTVTSAPAQLLVIGAPQITGQPQAASAAPGATTTFSVQASGEQLRYQWTRNGNGIAGAVSASFTTDPLSAADNGAVYGVIVYNGAGLVTSSGAVLTVTTPGGFSTFAIGGMVSGLTGAGLVLQNNGANNLAVPASGVFSFAAPVAAGAPYAVTVLTQPAGQTCSVQNGSGMASAAVSNVAVTCVNGAPAKAWQGAGLLETLDVGGALNPQVAFDASGNAVAAWNQVSAGGFFSIYVRRYEAATGWGTAEKIRVADNSNHYDSPQIVLDAAGNANIVFSGQVTESFPTLFTARYLVANPGWSQATALEEKSIDSKIAIDSSGNAMLVYSFWNGNYFDIRARRFDAGGGAWGAARTLSADIGGSSPEIAFDGSGNAMAIWRRANSNNTGTQEIMGDRYVAGSGWNSQGLPSRVATFAAGASRAHRLAASPAGDVIAVWLQSDGGNTESVYSSRYVAGAWGVPDLVKNSANRFSSVAVAMTGNADAIVVWHENDVNFIASMWARRYTAGVGGTAVRIDDSSTYTTGGFPQIAMNAAGRATAVWSQGSLIWANRYAAGSGWAGAERIDSAAEGGGSSVPRVAMDGNGNAVAVWPKSGVTGPDIWANVFK